MSVPIARDAARPGRRLRVLHAIYNLNYGGMERLLADLVRRADPARFESHVLVLESIGRFGAGLDQVATIHRAAPMSRWSMFHPAALARQVRDIAPDVVHTHSGVWFKVSLAARRAGVPWIVHTEHGRARPDPLAARLVDGWAARRTHAVVAVSEALREQLARSVVADRSRIHTIINGVDTEAYRPRPDDGALRARLGIGADVPIVGSIGRLEPIKGYDVMVAAFARLRRAWPASQGPAPVLVLVGDGGERPRLEAELARGGVADAAHLLGWRDDIHAMHSAFTLFSMSSRSEGTSVSLLEAMSAGLCPVVTDVGGNAATLGPGLAHRLVPSESPDALAAAWRAALTDDEARRGDAWRARERVRHAFALDAMVAAYERLYALAPRRPR